MPRFFFDIYDDIVTIDEEGIVLADIDDVRKKAMSILPKIAADEIPADGDRQHLAVLVTDETRHPVYSATLSYHGLWFHRSRSEMGERGDK